MDRLPNFSRTVILGNSGSGKSWLAKRMSRRLAIPIIDLDLIHWEPGGYNEPREKRMASDMVRELAKGDAWVIEGVYGWLAHEALPHATALIWLDIEIGECIANLKRRGIRRGGDEASFSALFAWTEEYRTRTGSSSFLGHQRVLSSFLGHKLHLRSRAEMAELLRSIG